MKFAVVFFILATAALADCDLAQYRAMPGLEAAQRPGVPLEIAWSGERGEQLRAAFTIQNGRPVVEQLSARKAGAKWIILGRNLSPEYQVTTGKRRLSEQ